MERKLIIIFTILLISTNFLGAVDSYDDRSSQLQNDKRRDLLDDLPIYKQNGINSLSLSVFTENRGQLDNSDVRFYTQDGSVWFTNDGAWFRMAGEGVEAVVKQSFVNSNPASPVGREPAGWNSNFFYGNDPSGWISNVPNYREIYFEDIYDDIDLRYYFSRGDLKYDIIVHPGADADQIKIRYDGITGLDIDSYNNIVLKTEAGNIKDSDLFVYQDNGNTLKEINAKFIKLNDFGYGFEIIGAYDTREVLVIDPVIDFSTFIGGTDEDYGNKIDVDSNGNSYITGYTISNDFPTTPGANDTTHNGGSTKDEKKDVYVTKLDSMGTSLLYSTYIGGNNFDVGNDIDIDTNGNAYVTGETRSANFPTTAGANDTVYNGTDAFVFKLNPNGSILSYSTFLGGTSTDRGNAIEVNSNGNAFITGYTSSSDFKTTPDVYDTSFHTLFITKLSADGSSLTYSTYIGGTSMDTAKDLAIDKNGNSYVICDTFSSDFPTSIGAYDSTLGGIQDIILFKLNWNGTELLYSTYLGGSARWDYSYKITVDSSGYAYIAGRTESRDFPTTVNAYDTTMNDPNFTPDGDCIITKFDQSGSSLVYSTFIGGTDSDYPGDLAVDLAGNIYFVGYTKSTGFPTSSNALYKNFIGGTYDGFITRLNADGTKLTYSSFIGGSSSEYLHGIQYQSPDNIYIIGETFSTNFPTTPGAHNRTLYLSDAFVMKLDFQDIFNLTSTTFNLNGNPTNQVYSALGPYTLTIETKNTLSIYDLNTVRVYIDQGYANIELLWNRSSNEFTEISDPEDYISIDQNSYSINDNTDSWTVNFNITFNWSYPHENLNDIKIMAISSVFPPVWLNTTGVFAVENDLDLIGTLSVKTFSDLVVNQNDVIKGGPNLKWTGLTTVYQGTTGLYPPDNDFDVALWDGLGGSWTDSPTAGQPFYIEIPTEAGTNEVGINYTINITGIPNESDVTDVYFRIRYDNDNVTFHDPKPLENIWHTSSDVKVGINITDIGGAMVDGLNTEYTVSSDNGTTWTDWDTVFDLDVATTVSAEEPITFDDGIDNLIKWRASDTVGNGPVVSDTYRLWVDTEDVEFSNAWPSTDTVSKIEAVETSITIDDVTSGIDADTIEYAVSSDSGLTWGDWTKVAGHVDGGNIEASVNHTFYNGTANMIKWRASDIAGNGPTESTPLTINVNTWTPPPVVKQKVKLLSPVSGKIINETSVELIWLLDGSTIAGVTYDLYLQNTTPPGIYEEDLSDTSKIISNLEPDETYYWTVIPVLSGVDGDCISGIWSFMIKDTAVPPDTKIYKVGITGPDKITLKPGETKSVELSITNLGNQEDSFTFEMDRGGLPKSFAEFESSSALLSPDNTAKRILTITLPKSKQPGTYEINITATSENGGPSVTDFHIVTVEVLKKDTDGGAGQDDDGSQELMGLSSTYLFTLVAIVIVVVIISVLLLMKRKKAPEDVETQDIGHAEVSQIEPGQQEMEQPAYPVQVDQITPPSEPQMGPGEVHTIPAVTIPLTEPTTPPQAQIPGYPLQQITPTPQPKPPITEPQSDTQEFTPKAENNEEIDVSPQSIDSERTEKDRGGEGEQGEGGEGD